MLSMQPPGLVLGQYRGFAAFHNVLRPAHRMGRVCGKDLADHQPVEQHTDGGQVLFYGRLGVRGLQRLDIGGNVDRLDIGELVDPVLLKPGEEVAYGPVIGHPGVLVADRCGKELQEPARRMIASAGDHCRHREPATQ